MLRGRIACPRGHGIFRGPCPVCARLRDQQRPGARARGYSPAWDTYSRAWLARRPWCGQRADGTFSAEHSRCVREQRRVPADVTDHIVAIADGGAVFDRTNHQSLCSSCNTAKNAPRLKSDH
jgi:5-methylcytosine-specific restriction endonuclease McrA